MDQADYWKDRDASLENLDVEEFFREEQQTERERLEDELENVENLLDERDELHTEAIEELESKLDWYCERLEQVYKRRGKQQKRERLKAKIEGIYEGLRREGRQQWRDKIELEMRVTEIERALDEVTNDSLEDFL